MAIHELRFYTSLLTNAISEAPEKMDYYWQQIVKLNEKLTNPYDRYNYFLSMDNYYLNQKPQPHYEKALMANDSLIQIAQENNPQTIYRDYTTFNHKPTKPWVISKRHWHTPE